MVTRLSHSPAETEAWGELWGRDARRGWLIGLIGELGAGKTQLVKGLARGLGIAERVHSPTFALIHQYDGGRLTLCHLDFYRLETPQAIQAAGLDEYLFDPVGVTVVEWIERWPDFSRGPSGPYRRVVIECVSESDRRIQYEDFGA
jgi:tRNA threonylcarbamoyladenosine biosynthesis protein TsaE